MIDQHSRELFDRILELTDTACQASLELLERCTDRELEAAKELLLGLDDVAQAVSTAQEPFLPQLEHAYTSEMLINVQDTLEEIRHAIQANMLEQASMKTELQLLPFFRQLREAFYFWGLIYPDRERMERYYQEEFAEHYQNLYLKSGGQPRYRATVVVVAYNHLEMTRQCVESILKYTDFEKLNAQLILVDHGSTDGVRTYFESLGRGSVIHYKANMRGTMFCALPQVCNSEYYVHVANDTVVTKDWLEILLTCADSDPEIAAAVPATCNMSNLQAINVPSSDCDTVVGLAEAHNRSNSRLWSDRARVLPGIGLFRLSALNEIGFWDPLFYTFDYMDDDFSLRARRRGYRQILCEDVMCYHRGSATVKDVQTKEDTLGEGRRLFLQKHGVDPWGPGFCYDLHGVQLYQLSSDIGQSVNILGVDCGFGDTALQLRSQLRRGGREGRIYHVTTDVRYLPDLKPHSDETVCTTPCELLSALEGCFLGYSFGILFLGQNLEQYPEPYQLLAALAQRMSPGGELVFSFSNPYFAVRLHQMLQLSIPDSPLCLLHPEQVGERAGKLFSSVTLTGVTQPIQGLDEFIVRYYGKEFLKSTHRSRLEVIQYYVKCVK